MIPFGGWPEERPNLPDAAFRSILNWETQVALYEELDRFEEPIIVCELGSWVGESGELFARSEKVKELYCIDTWLGATELLEYMEQIGDLYERFCWHLWEYRHKVHPCRLDSVGGLYWLKSQGIVPRLIFVDAGHHYEQVFGDLHAALTLFPEAVLVLDDFTHQDVARAASECALIFARRVVPHGWAAVLS